VTTEPRDQQEPSMEEILSSIRRIIADEEADDGKPGEDRELGTAEAARDYPEEADEDDDVLELTRMVREGGEVVDLRAEDRGEAGREAGAIDEPGAPSPERAGDDRPARADETAAEEPALVTPPPQPAAQASPSHEETRTVPKQAAAGELISDAAATAATGAFARLSQAFQRTPADEAIADAEGRTVEQFIEDMMRPMLRQWLDENLPRIVEEKVERELQKIARRSELL
jgi:uncharacterized protein